VFILDLLATVPYYTAYLTRALMREAIEPSLASVSYYLDRTCFSSRGVTVHPGCLDLVSRYSFPRFIRRPLKLLEALINQSSLMFRFWMARPDILHVQFLPMLTWRLPFDFWFVLWCRKRGIKVVLTVHDLLPHDTGQEYKEKFLRLYQSVDRIICHSGHVKDRLAGEFSVENDRVSVIPHGPFFYDLMPAMANNTLSHEKINPRPVRFLWQGIIHPYKGVDLLLEEWRKVESPSGENELIIAGTGSADLLRQIREQVQSLKLRNVVLKLEFISAEELIELYREADVVVYPYRAITTSGSLATGLALGKTIVASDLPVFRELLTDRLNALLVNVDDPDALANALSELARNPALREGLALQVRAMNFGEQCWTEIARTTVETYRRVLA
jgi:glycosyltransferase involved in cell wall biosynthesis